MAEYPSSISLPQSINEVFYKAQIRTPFEDGSAQSRVKHTKGRGRWELSYDEVPISYAYVLRDFFYANQGTVFTWTNPMNSIQYNVRFSEDEIQVKIDSPNNCAFTVKIEEA